MEQTQQGHSVKAPMVTGGNLKLDIPGGTQHGEDFRFPREGILSLIKDIRGDLVARVKIISPRSGNKKMKGYWG